MNKIKSYWAQNLKKKLIGIKNERNILYGQKLKNVNLHRLKLEK